MKKLELYLAIGLLAVLPYLMYYVSLHYILLPPITLESRNIALALAFTVTPFLIIASSFLTLVWKEQQEYKVEK